MKIGDKGGERRKPQSGMARSAIEGPGNAQQAGRERAGLDREVPYPRGQNRDVGSEQRRRPILGDTFGEGSEADEARGNVGGAPRVRAILGDVFGVPYDAVQKPEAQPAEPNDESPHSPG